MSLADQIVERNIEQNPNTEVDEFGIPVPHPETPEYLVARALILHQPSDANELTVHCLHLRNGQLYLGHQPLEENRDTIYRLTQLKRSLRDWERIEFWRLLRQYVPKMSRRFLCISGDLYWDVDKAELVNRQQAEERSKNG